VPLTEGVLDRQGSLQFLEASGSHQVIQFLPLGAVRMRREEQARRMSLFPRAQARRRGRKGLDLRNQRGLDPGLWPRTIATELGLPARERL